MLVTFKSEGFVFKSSGSNYQQPAVQTFFVRSRVIEGLNGLRKIVGIGWGRKEVK